MPRKPPRKRKGSHTPAADQDLLDLLKACRIGNPNMTMKEFERWAEKNYTRSNTKQGSIIRKANRMLQAQKKTAGQQTVDFEQSELAVELRKIFDPPVLTPTELKKIFEDPEE